MIPVRAVLVWAGLAVAVAGPIAVAANSPLLQWRGPIYIASGFAGMLALCLVLIQPLLAAGYLPGLPARPGRRMHRWIGVALVIMVMAHVGGLWLTSAPDVIDALLFDSPTPFSVWGVVALWAVFAAALLAVFRAPLRIRPRTWRIAHSGLAVVIALGSVAHALLVEGTMGQVSKSVLCILVLAALIKVLIDLRTWTLLMRRRA
ncbi:MAG: ferric reductase-like transmembrane domain-containing protein [Hyphomicrobiales bacterium]|nr:ferric reductase-like transmembrane domain-containing protein [Hyphomicrobiales bacterium]